MKLLIRNLDRDTTESELKDLFEGYGTVQFCNLVLDKVTGKSKGFAFVEMPKQGDAKAAMKNLNNSILDGNMIRVKKAENKGQTASADCQQSSASNTQASASEAKPQVSPYRRKT